MDVARFLGAHPPFDALDGPTLARVAGSVQVEFFTAGTTILEQAGEPSRFLYVVRAGIVEVVADGRILDLMGEGEAFGFLSLAGRFEPTASIRAHEDTICYLIDRDLATEVLGTPAGLSYMSGLVRRRLAGQEEVSPGGDLYRVRVESLIRRAPVTRPGSTTVREAAQVMARHRVSALLVPVDDGWGILTDRDLRSRVLATGRSSETPVSEVMTFPAHTIPGHAMAAEVLLEMLEQGFHHLPVVDEHGRLAGVVTDTDLMGLERASPFALKSAIERSTDQASAVEATRGLPSTVVALVQVGVDPVEVGHIVGVTLDALTRRLLELAIGRLGEPPIRWAWLALGSQARHEQALHTDQDHAMALADERPTGHQADDVEAYFALLARTVTGGLASAGIPRCRGDAMAENAAMRRSVTEWATTFRDLMSDPGAEGSVLSSIVFDYRRVAGSLDVEPALDAEVASARERFPEFLRRLARRALDQRPPTGFFRDLVVEAKGEHAGTLDVKHRGIMIVTNLARAYAVRAGDTSKTTRQRLAAAEASGQIDGSSRASLEEAFRLLWDVRLEHQAAQVQAGETPDDFVDPSTLGPIRKRALKEAFRVVAHEQQMLAADLGVS